MTFRFRIPFSYLKMPSLSISLWLTASCRPIPTWVNSLLAAVFVLSQQCLYLLWWHHGCSATAAGETSFWQPICFDKQLYWYCSVRHSFTQVMHQTFSYHTVDFLKIHDLTPMALYTEDLYNENDGVEQFQFLLSLCLKQFRYSHMCTEESFDRSAKITLFRKRLLFLAANTALNVL